MTAGYSIRIFIALAILALLFSVGRGFWRDATGMITKTFTAFERPELSREEAEEILEAVIGGWDFDAFEQRLDPLRRHQVPREALRSLFRAIASRLGSLNSYDSFEIREVSGMPEERPVRVSMEGLFLKGRARVETDFVYREESWWIAEVAVHSPLMQAVHDAARKAYDGTDFDAGLFYYELAV